MDEVDSFSSEVTFFIFMSLKIFANASPLKILLISSKNFLL